MLERFRACYPTGCLISELVTIHNGKYVVRVLVRVNGETLATGLGAADTVELAEDQARERSLATLPLNLSIPAPEAISSSQEKTSVKLAPTISKSASDTQINSYVNTSLEAKTEELPTPVSNLDSNLEAKTEESPTPVSNLDSNPQTVSSGLEKLENSTPLPKVELPKVESNIKDNNLSYSPQNSSGFDDNWLNTDYSFKDKEEIVDEVTEKFVNSTNDTEKEITTSKSVDYNTDLVVSNNGNEDEDIDIESNDIYSSNSTLDLSDNNANIDILIDTLNWTKEQERDCLEQNYNQKTRDFLTPEELLNFQQYLELMAKVTEEMKRQSWKKKQKEDYLEYNHQKQSFEQLSIDELEIFLQYLEVFGKTTNEIKRLGWNANKGKTYLKQNYGEEGRTRLSYEQLQDFLQNLEALLQ